MSRGLGDVYKRQVEVINDASVKFNELVKEENEEKALAGAEGEVN